MTKRSKKIATFAVAAVMTASGASGLLALTGCGGNKEVKSATYNTYTTVMPSNWCELTYQDNNDTQIMDYIVSSFYEYDYKYDEAKGGKFDKDGNLNKKALISDNFDIKYSAATKLEDVTAAVAKNTDFYNGYEEADLKDGGFAWKITLRDDLKWDDGTAIKAKDFVYTMEQQLDPLFQNYRADTFYNNLDVVGAYDYLNSNTKTLYRSVAAAGYKTNQAAVDAGKTLLLNTYSSFGMKGAQKVTSFDLDKGTVETDAKSTIKQYMPIDDETLYLDPAYDPDDESITLAECIVSTKDIYEYFVGAYGAAAFEVGGPLASLLAVEVDNKNYGADFEDLVGFYSTGDYELVVCFQSPYSFLNEDGSLSVWAGYYMSSFPLVKKDLYEKCKIAPVEGSNLWTTNYNSSVETSASWGPYKLTSFQAGKQFILEKNENWFGYGLEDNAGQYQIEKIVTDKIDSTETAWMSFLAGKIDDIGIDVTHKDDYKNSKYAHYTPSSATYNMILFADLETLKAGDRNNGILAITDFRKALSLGIDRADYNNATSTASSAGYGFLNDSYYYDIENNGKYRDTDQAKEAILRAYGYTLNDKGQWTDGSRTYKTLDKAYDSVTGYNLTLAKELIEKAYKELTDNASKYGYDASKKIEIKFGTSVDNEATRRNYNYFKNMIDNLVKGTSLEGKVDFTFDASFGSQWVASFTRGEYDLASAGMSGAIFDPTVIIDGWLDPQGSITDYWNTEEEEFTFTMPKGDYAGAGETLTMPIMNWDRCLRGTANKGDKYTYNWGVNAVPHEVRLTLMAALEELILTKYYIIPVTASYSSTMLGAKFSYITEDYNVFMGYGGIRYMQVNYTDSEWDAYVAKKNGDLTKEYKKS